MIQSINQSLFAAISSDTAETFCDFILWPLFSHGYSRYVGGAESGEERLASRNVVSGSQAVSGRNRKRLSGNERYYMFER